MHNLSYGNEFDLQDSKRARKAHFHIKDCASRVVLKKSQRQLGNGSLTAAVRRIITTGEAFSSKYRQELNTRSLKLP